MTPADEAVYLEWLAVHEARREHRLELVAEDHRRRMADGYRLVERTQR